VQVIAAIGGLSFILASFVTGARLLLVARRTRQLPELTLGLGLFLMGGLGYPLTLLGEFGTFLPDDARAGFIAGNQLSSVIGLPLLVYFTARVFRPESAAARTLVWLIGLTFVGMYGFRAATYGFAPVALGGEKVPTVHSILTLVCLGWAGLESLFYHLQLRKRVRLGLADPILANRMLLWAVGMLCAMMLTGISTLFSTLGIAFDQTTPGILTIGIMGTTSAASVWFAFFPPAAYVKWIRARSGVEDPAQTPETIA
jgi:hypothetical protein